jgi:hypothetical protein
VTNRGSLPHAHPPPRHRSSTAWLSGREPNILWKHYTDLFDRFGSYYVAFAHSLWSASSPKMLWMPRCQALFINPLNRAQREIRLILLDHGNETIGSGGAASTLLRCQLITTLLAFYSTRFDNDIVDVAMAATAVSNSPLALVGVIQNAHATSRSTGKFAKITKNLAEALQSIRAKYKRSRHLG